MNGQFFLLDDPFPVDDNDDKRQEAMTRAITYWMTLPLNKKTQVSQFVPRSYGLGLYLLDDPFRRRLSQLRYQDMRKDAITQAFT